MKRYLLNAFIVILSLSLMAVLTMGAMAVEDSSDTLSTVDSSVSSSSEEQNSSDTESSDSSTDDSSDSSEGTSSSDTSNDDTSSDSDSSEDSSSDEASSDETESGDSSDTTSSNTSSKRPITSQGGGGGSTFIDETGSQIAQGNSSVTVSVPSDLVGTEPDEEEEMDDDEHFEGKTTSAAQEIYRIIWIPILIAVLCVAGLIYVNVFVRKKVGIEKTQHKKKPKKN